MLFIYLFFGVLDTRRLSNALFSPLVLRQLTCIVVRRYQKFQARISFLSQFVPRLLTLLRTSLALLEKLSLSFLERSISHLSLRVFLKKTSSQHLLCMKSSCLKKIKNKKIFFEKRTSLLSSKLSLYDKYYSTFPEHPLNYCTNSS